MGIMYCIHITENKNLKSIKQKGLLPSRPYLSNHRDLFKYYFKKEKIIYLTVYENKKRTGKFIKDFVYFQLWGKPRNIWGQNNEWGGNGENIYNKFFKIKFAKFSILGIQINLDNLRYIKGIHQQDSSLNLLENIDERFSHNDKPLLVISEKIKSDSISELGFAIPMIRNNKIENVRLEGWE